jgi:subfamily B ATP-binding cassette protein MsbA
LSGTTNWERFKKSWSYVLPYFKGHNLGIFVVLVLTVIAASTESIIALSVKKGLEWFYINPEIGKKIVWTVPVFIVSIFFYRAVFTFTSKYLLERICLKVLRDIQVALYRHFIYLSVDHYDRTSTGEMMARTVADAQYMSRLVPIGIESLRMIFNLTGLLAVCIYLQPELMIIAVIAIPLTVFPVQTLSQRMKRYTKKSLKQVAGINTILQETYAGARVIKAFAREAREVERYGSEMNRLLKIQFTYAVSKHLISPLIGVVASFGVAAISYILTSVIVEQLSRDPSIVANYGAFIAAVGMMYNPVRKLGETVGHFNSAYGAVERIQETFERQSTVTEAPEAVDIPPIKETIRYDNVDFKYDQEYVLKQFSLEIKKGELVALVGESGAGKTTVVNLLPRFYDVTGGKIAIDGTDIRKATFSSLRMQIGVVYQETFLFNDTVFYNISYGSDNKTKEDVVAAAKAAFAHEFIMELPGGYDTMIGERGVRLSGGQRQRIAIARALLKDPPILILDEATSALDTQAEREVQKALDTLMKNRTTVAIAHRLSTVRHADKIVVIKDFRVVEQGTHAELMALDGEYKRLYEMQFFLGEYATDHYGGKREEGQAAGS